MALIIYGGARDTVLRQLKCSHKWHGPCMDRVSRYFKCLKCFCLERDLRNEEELWKAEKEAATRAADKGDEETDGSNNVAGGCDYA